MTEARAAAVFTQSLDYNTCVNSAWLDEERTQGYTFVVKKDAARWLVVLLTVLVVCGIDIAIKSLSKCKYSWLQMYSDCGVQQEALTLPYPLFVALNIGPALVAAFLGSYVEPVAAGSGIPQVKCYLNGAKVSRVVRLKTLMSRAVGVTSSVLGGRAMGEVVGKVCCRELTTKMLLPTVPAMAKGRVAKTTDDGPLLDKERRGRGWLRHLVHVNTLSYLCQGLTLCGQHSQQGLCLVMYVVHFVFYSL
ncbi:H(+)/Cl(-) exchange transporter 7-like isoform X1 [Eriocheir sinensis]|uniref:H(+)/Cl(-) exchange transporter 7-like isoform X1 n=1 Tax=Eriocheir sinensis TaxID=95602 RepID=UPI0021C88002|nr:H(+)/Cl(-) exchange transporter 7-like isoform X1 [Eriocheir sinensis]